MKNTEAVIENGEIVHVTKTPATVEELKNAIWLRENRSGLIASAFHGGQAKGFHIAISNIPTEQIQQSLLKLTA